MYLNVDRKLYATNTRNTRNRIQVRPTAVGRANVFIEIYGKTNFQYLLGVYFDDRVISLLQ